MQIFGTATSPLVTGIGVGMGTSKYTDIVTQCVNTLATGSSTSVTDQLNAFQTLTSLIFSGDGKGNGGVLQQTNQNDFNRALTAIKNCEISKNINQVGSQFGSALSSAVSSAGDNPNIAQCKLDVLSRFSSDDQQILLAGSNYNVAGANVVGGQDQYYTTVDAWKSALKQQAVAFTAQQQASATAASSIAAAAISSAATPALTTVPVAAITSKPASQTGIALPAADNIAATNASVALQILLKAQDAMHKSATAFQTATTATSRASSYAAAQAAAMLGAPKAATISSSSQLDQTA